MHMKLTMGILVLGMAAATAWGQNPDVIQNTRDTMKAVQQKKAMDSNAALDAAGVKRAPSARKTREMARPAAHRMAPMSPRSQAAARHARKVEHVSVSVADNKPVPDAPQEKHRAINLTGQRDPFLSPVVMQSMVGSGCSTGKKCLSIGQIVLKGVVKSDSGMIAVVVNALDKAYFLRENDPVFDGYVVRITGDSVVFKESFQDKLGRPATREVTKRIITPAV
jgi:Tfp pilus assembly protein PilP